MKRFLLSLVLAASLVLTSCSDPFDDSAIWETLDEYGEAIKDHEQRIAALEELCKQMNTNISSLQTIIEALQNKDYVTAVVPIVKDGITIGYTITFSKSQPVTIYHGEDGKDGANGQDGKDGYTPQIGVKQDEDGVYYWTLDGEWLLDESGNKIKAVGTDGKDGADGSNGNDGQNGADGKDGITPQLKIEDDYWYISYDNGATWTKLGKATGEDGKDGQDGANGSDGDSFFQSVDTSSEDYVVFTLADGTQIKLPTWYAFEQLRTLCNQMNTNINSLQTIIQALQNADYLISCTPLIENGVQIGYTLTFSKSGSVVIYHGKDGANGQDGKDGADGKDGYTPQIGVKQDTDGIYYWTLDGEWLLDESGNKIKAVGTDSKDGQNGKDGADGVTPQLKIENNYWYVSYDNGVTWTQLGKATGEDGQDGQNGADGSDGKDGDSFFESVTQDEECVYLTLADGTIITLPKHKPEAANCKIYYTTSDGKKLFPNITEPALFGAILISNIYEDGKGVLTFDDTISSIGERTFDDCSSLASITIPDSVTSIGNYAFESCTSLTSIVIPDSVTSIGGSAFENCFSLTRVDISDLSAWCMISFGTFDANPLYYGAKLYLNGSELTDITIPSDITEIKYSAFFGYTSLTSVTIPDSVTSIGNATFRNCTSLTSIAIPDSVIEIGYGAFDECTSLTSVTIPDSVTSIGNYAFRNCSLLKEVCCKPTTPPTGGNYMFDYNASGRKIYVPTVSVEAYKAAKYWSDYASNIEGYEF